MQRKEGWTRWLVEVPYGKRLVQLHKWNAWLVLALAVTGILLFVEPLRELGQFRIGVKTAHIWLGVLSVVLVVLYLPLLGRHWRGLGRKRAQRWNLGGVLFLLAGWSVTGMLLWAVRSLPPSWGNGALLLHDLFTWVGVPYAIYHSISRSRWVKTAPSPGRSEKIGRMYSGRVGSESEEWKGAAAAVESASASRVEAGSESEEWKGADNAAERANTGLAEAGSESGKWKGADNAAERANTDLAEAGSESEEWKEADNAAERANAGRAEAGSESEEWKSTDNAVEAASAGRAEATAGGRDGGQVRSASAGRGEMDVLPEQLSRTAIVRRRLVEVLQEAPVSRASFLRMTAGLLLVVGVGPYFYRWLKRSVDSGGSALEELAARDGNRMLPPPVPLPASNPPAGGGAQGQFRVYTVTDIPSFSSESWTFEVSGLVEQERQWDWSEFNQLERTVQVSDFHCITGWSVYQVTWEGIPLREMLKLAGVKAEGRFVKFYSGDGVYTDCLSLEQAQMEDMMVAVLMDGKPIPQQLGGPVRLITPQMYAYKSVKWLQAIELIEEEHIGYWELRGYDKDAWVKGSRLS